MKIAATGERCCRLGEGLVRDAASGTLHRVDSLDPKLYRYRGDSRSIEYHDALPAGELPGRVPAVDDNGFRGRPEPRFKGRGGACSGPVRRLPRLR